MVSTVKNSNKTQRTVKAFEVDIALINERAKDMGCSAAEVIHDMCQDLRKEVYLQELGETFDSLRADAKQLAKLEAKQRLWDSSLSDGLNDAS